MTTFITGVIIVAAIVIFVVAIVAAASAATEGYDGGEYHWSKLGRGEDSYENTYFGPWSWIYDWFYEVGKNKASTDGKRKKQERIERNREKWKRK